MTSMLTLRPRNRFLLDANMQKEGRIDYQDCTGLRSTEAEATRPTFAQEPALLEMDETAMNAEGLFFCPGCVKRRRFHWHTKDKFHRDPTRRNGITYLCSKCRSDEADEMREKHHIARQRAHHTRPNRRKR